MLISITGYPNELIDDSTAWPGHAAPYSYQQYTLQWVMRWFLTATFNALITKVVTLKAKPGAGKTRICMGIARVVRDLDLVKAFPSEVETVTLRQWSGNAAAIVTKKVELNLGDIIPGRAYTVVVVPVGSALEKQWEAQLAVFGGDLRVTPLHPRSTFDAKAQAVRDGEVDVLIVRASMVNEWNDLATKHDVHPPRLVMIDEAKGMESNGTSIVARAYIKLSATPDADAMNSEFTHVFEVPDALVDTCVALPAPIVHRHVAVIQEREARVWRELPPDLRESLEAGDIGRVAAALHIDVAGGVDAIRERMLRATAADLRAAEADLAMWQEQLERLPPAADLEAADDDERAAERRRLEGRTTDAQKEADRCRDTHEALRGRLEDTLAECPVCGEEEPVGPVLFPCTHGMCSECFVMWLGRSGGQRVRCPTCQRMQSPEDCMVVNPDDSAPPEEPRTKKEHLTALIKQVMEGNGRAVVFTTTVNGTDSFKDVVLKAVDDPALVAKCSRKAEVVEGFQNGDIRIMLMDAEHMAEGLELQCASDLIITGPLDPMVERQVVGRCQRVGRENALRVHWLLNQMEAAEQTEA